MALRDILVVFGVEVDQTPLDQAQQKTDRLLDTFRGGIRVAQAFAAGLVGHALTRFITETVKAADDVGDFAARLGITTDEFQVLKAVADDAGTNIQSVQTGFRTLATLMKGTGKDAGKEFRQLGVEIRNADGSLRSTTDVFWDTGAALAGVEDQATRLDLTQKLLGRTSLQLLPIFSGGAEAVAKYRAEIEATAVVFDQEFIEASDATAKSLAHLHHRWERIKVVIVSQILPAFNWLVHQLESAVSALSDFIKSGKAMQALLAVGSAFLLRWAAGFQLVGANIGSLVGWMFRVQSAARILWRILLRFALPVLIIDELITLFRGGDTLIGRFIDKLFGVGKAAAMVDLVRGAVSSLLDTLGLLFNSDGVEDWELAFIKASEGIANAFDAMFAGLWQVAKDFGEFFQLVIGQAVDWVVGKIKSIPGVETIMGALSAPQGGGFGPGVGSVVPAIAPPPALSAGAVAGAASGGAPGAAPQVTNNITVEGAATPAVAREIAQRAGAATGAALGRDRAAIGASVGVSSP